MKILITSFIFLTTSLFANYAYDNNNFGKIDMHGGKSDKLNTGKNKFSNDKFNTLGEVGINKPTMPMKPTTLIKKEEKTKEKKASSKTTK